MKENRLWLYEENETEFVADEAKLSEKVEQIIKNKRVIDAIIHEKGVPINEEKRFEIMSGVSSLLLENGDLRKNLPPFTPLQKEKASLMSDFIKAENALSNMLKKEPYLFPDQFPILHKIIIGSDENVADKDKGKFRDSKSDLIQMGYFMPTKGSDVSVETALAFSKYGYVEGEKVENHVMNNLIRIAKLHAQIVRIQPFMDGNKRIAFLATNGMLQLSDLLPITLCETEPEQERYSAALKKAIVGRDVTDLAEAIIDSELKHQQQIIDYEAISEIDKELSKKDLLFTK